MDGFGSQIKTPRLAQDVIIQQIKNLKEKMQIQKQNLKNNLLKINPEKFLEEFLIKVSEKIKEKNNENQDNAQKLNIDSMRK